MKVADQGLTLYADAFGIPRKVSVPFIKSFLKWIECSGEEWTVSRMKAIKLDFVRLKAGLEPVHNWISFSNGSFKGSIKGLQTWCSFHKKRWSKAIQLLQIYTTCISSSVTPSQERKFLDGVQKENSPIPESISTMVRVAAHYLGLNIPYIPLPRPLALEQFSDMRFAPHPNGRTYPERDCVLEGLSYLTQTQFGWSIRARYSAILDAVMEGIEFEDLRDAPEVIDFPDSVGRIGIIQEPGFKLRAVANPGRVYQQALRPLGESLYRILQTLPWDCTHNQSLPFDIIRNALRNSTMVHSVDLSGATDYFPFDLQLEVLDKIIRQKEHINLFRDISRGSWLYGSRTIRWTRGQPLGLHPSFASFALTHGLLLFALNNFKHENAFFVLGDDVVILDSHLHTRYRQVLNELECPISEPKSISSTKLAEFGGKIITSDSVINQLKWRSVSDDSFLDIVRNIGPKALFLLKPRQRKIARILWEVPDFFGGLGFNPSGKPLDIRVAEALELLEKDNARSYLLGYTRMINYRNYYDRRSNLPQVSYRILEADFDKKSVSLILQYVPTLLKWYSIAGKNLFSINPELSLYIDGQSSSRVSLLEKMERTLL